MSAVKSTAIVVSGLPASGKTTIGNLLSEVIQAPVLDKDDFLERLFEEHAGKKELSRQVLSRQSDALFEAASARMRQVILISHWRPPGNNGNSGTPTEWILKCFDNVLEVYCECRTAVAAARFIERDRHIAHLDNQKTPEEIEAWMEEVSSWYPLNLGECIRVASENEVNTAALTQEIQSCLSR